MPPKVQYTREKIIDAALEVIREAGAENLNARAVAQKIGCSTQPVMYHFKTVEELKQEVYKKADEYHTEFLMDTHGDNPFLDIGLNYIRFAAEERFLFQFLFQSDGFSGRSLSDLIEAEESRPLLEILGAEAGVEADTAKRIFRSVFMTAHGYASMLANNRMRIDEETVTADLHMIFAGAVSAAGK